ncbi:MAG: NAD-dependent epimerase/dehydratase family protein [Myxococcota bacterium]
MSTRKNVIVTGATGFVGHALIPALLARGHRVFAATRKAPPATPDDDVTWVPLDLSRPATVRRALQRMDCAYYLVHGMAHSANYERQDERFAYGFARAAAASGVQRIIYLGGPIPAGRPSRHLRSRLRVGEILRAGAVPTLELRASMIVGAGSASWQLARDLALRIPVLLAPRWLDMRMQPVAIDDVVTALVAGLTFRMRESAAYDLGGPEILTGLEILQRIAALSGRRAPTLPLPLVTPRQVAPWLPLLTRANPHVAHELLLGMTSDLLARSDEYWHRIHHPHRLDFNTAAQRALQDELPGPQLRNVAAVLEEALVEKLRPSAPRPVVDTM